MSREASLERVDRSLAMHFTTAFQDTALPPIVHVAIYQPASAPPRPIPTVGRPPAAPYSLLKRSTCVWRNSSSSSATNQRSACIR